MASAVQDLEVSASGCCLVVRNVNLGSPNITEIYNIANIVRVVPLVELGYGTRNAVTNQRKHSGAQFDDLLKVTVEFIDKSPPLDIQIQRVSNQAGWTSDEAGVQQAVDDFCQWISDCQAGGGGGGGGATEATLAAYTALFSGTEITGSQALDGAIVNLATNTYYSITLVVGGGTVVFDGDTYDPGTYSWGANPFKKCTGMSFDGSSATNNSKLLTTQ